ncbi:Glutathione S-transferase PARB [Platanthera guangdongensis]|uniref:glutathione transferase n=1 Tax=Platanthera guangdongensis TaxID=2320717 RepID=A0ABR2MQ09_9ASPA
MLFFPTYLKAMMETPTVKVIYGKPMAPDLARVLACLNEKNIKYELEDMYRGKKMSQDILNLQISSHGPTPGLQDGTIELFGSRKICKYIAETYREYGYKSLLGEDPLARVSVEQWIQSEEQRFDPPSSALIFYLAYKIEQDDENATQSEKKLAKVLNLYEQRLGEFNFLAGDYFTLADLNHLPNTYFLEGSAEYGYLFKERKNVRKWWERISERAAWKNAVKKLKEEDLLFNIPEAHSETNSSSPRNKIAPQSPPTDPGIESKKDGLKTGDKVKDPSGKGEEPDPNKKSENQSSAQQDDQVKKGIQSPNPGTEGKQVVDDKDKDSSGKESKPDLNKKKESSGMGEADNKGKKDSAPTDAGTERKKDGLKPDDKAKDPWVKGEEPDLNKKSENHSTTQLDDQGKKGVQPPTEGKKVVDDKDKASSGKENKPDLNKKKESSGTAEPDNQRKIDSAATDPGTEGKKDGLKPNDKVKTPPGKGEEPDPNNKNENQDADQLDGQNKASSGNGDIPDPKKKEGSGPDEPDNQNKKGSAVTGVNGEISSGNNKILNPMDDQGNKSSTAPDAKDKYSSGDNKKPNSTDDQANKGSALTDANNKNPNSTEDQANKGSALTDANNKNPDSTDDQANKDSALRDANKKYPNSTDDQANKGSVLTDANNKNRNSTDDQANKGSAVPDANKENPNPTNPSFIDKRGK